MKIFCLDDFKIQLEQLKRKNSYQGLEQDLIYYFFGKTIDQLKSGPRLNNSDVTPYIKKRLSGSGGYRVYYLLIIKDECVYLMHVHPKTGSHGVDSISNEMKKELYKEVLEAIREKNLHEVTCSENKQTLIFEKVTKPKK